MGLPAEGLAGRLLRASATAARGSDELLAAPAGAGSGDTKRPAGAQARGQFAAQRAASLDIEGLVDGPVRDPKRLIIGESIPSRFAICSGLHAVAQRRS
jgi:hypothetical protein